MVVYCEGSCTFLPVQCINSFQTTLAVVSIDPSYSYLLGSQYGQGLVVNSRGSSLQIARCPNTTAHFRKTEECWRDLPVLYNVCVFRRLLLKAQKGCHY